LLENSFPHHSKHKQIMNLFWAILRNATAALHFESVRSFKTLPLSARRTARFRGREAVFAGTPGESFSLREIGDDVSL
jgi:hypothetical protein